MELLVDTAALAEGKQVSVYNVWWHTPARDRRICGGKKERLQSIPTAKLICHTVAVELTLESKKALVGAAGTQSNTINGWGHCTVLSGLRRPVVFIYLFIYSRLIYICYSKIIKPVNLLIFWNVQYICKVTVSLSKFTNLLKISGNLEINWNFGIHFWQIYWMEDTEGQFQ